MYRVQKKFAACLKAIFSERKTCTPVNSCRKDNFYYLLKYICREVLQKHKKELSNTNITFCLLLIQYRYFTKVNERN